MFDGGDPLAFKRYQRDLQLWQFDTEIPENKHGVKMLRQLTGAARAAADELTVEEITSAQGAAKILAKLKDHFAPYLESALPRAFEKAIYAEHRKSKESLQEYVIRMDGAFKELSDEGVVLNDTVKGYVLYRHASLTQVQEDQMTTWTSGSYERDKVIKALRKLEKVHRDQKVKSFVTEDMAGESSQAEETYGMFEDDDDPSYVWVGEGDLSEVFNEEDLQHALATYQEVRRAIREQKINRSSWNKGKGKSYGKLPGPFKTKADLGARKVHIDMLKLRTKCAKCGQVGHWAKECSSPPDSYARSKADSMSGKSGFFSASVQKDASVLWEGLQEHGSVITLGSFLRKNRHEVISKSTQFCGIATQPQHGVVDTAAQSGLVGIRALQRLEDTLNSHGLCVAWRDRQAQARGVGGEASVVGVAEVPLGIGGVCGVLECTVVEEDVPLLIPIRLLRDLGAQIDLAKNEMFLKKYEVRVPLEIMPSGHATTGIVEFGESGWRLPIEASQAGLQEQDFKLHGRHHSAMNGSSNRFQPNSQITQSSYNVFAMAEGSSAFGRGRRDGRDGSSSRYVELETSGKQDAQADARSRRTIRGGKRLAARWICFWLLTASLSSTHGTSIHGEVQLHELTHAYQQARTLCHTDPTGDLSWTPQVRQDAQQVCGVLQAPHELACRSGQPSAEGGLVSIMPCAMEGGLYSSHKDRGDTESSCRKIECSLQPGEPNSNDSGVSLDPGAPKGDQMSMQLACHATHGQEGWTDKGQALLQMSPACMPAVCVGPRGDQGNAAAATAGATDANATAVQSAEQRSREGQGGIAEEGAQDEGDGGRDAPSAASSTGGLPGSNTPATSGTAAATADSPITDPLHAGAGSVDDCSGRRGENDKGVPGLAVPGTNCRGDSSAEEGDGDPARSSIRPMKEEAGWDEAPWMCPIRNKGQLNTATAIQLREEGMRPADRKMSAGFWRRDSTGNTHYEPGILPGQLQPGEEILVGIFEELPEEDFMNEVDGVLKKGCRKRLIRALSNPKIAEVYSTPRITAEASKQGLPTGGAYDLKNGYDLNLKSDQERCFRRLEEEDPDVLVISPPCGPFSRLQEWNYGRMEFHKAKLMLQEGLHHLDYAMRLYEWQVRRGKIALFEHPRGAKSWEEPRVLRCMSLPGVEVVEADQCAFGLRVREEEHLNRKPTRFMVNSKHMASKLALRCNGNHQHQPLLHGRAKLAEQYPQALCKAVAQGAKQAHQQADTQLVFAAEEEEERDLEDDLDEAVEQAGGEAVQRWAAGQSLQLEDEEDEEGGHHMECAVSPEEKKLISKLHQNMGHPSTEAFARALRMGRARDEVIRYVKKSFKCDLCERHQMPKPARPATVPKSYEANQVVGVDVLYLPWIDPNEQVPVLNIVDWGTCYQILEPVQGMTAEKVWTAFQRGWNRIFGMPRIIVADQGREFIGEFARKAGEHGALLRLIGARAPWQNGRTERQGGVAKGIFEKLRDQVGPINEDEWMQCLHQVEATKNRMFHRSGFSPAQRQLGQNVRIPGSLMSDDDIEAKMLRGAASTDVRRALEIRDAALEAFARHNTQEGMKKATRARGRTTNTFTPGEVVYVFRKPLPRRHDTRTGVKPTWCGPGSVIMVEGPNAWISMRGELWKCALEQVRKATNEEEAALGLLKEEFEELKETLKRRQSKRAFKDITGWELPPNETEEEDEPPAQRRRLAQEEETSSASASSSSSSSTSTGSNPGDENQQEQAQQLTPEESQELREAISEEQASAAARAVIHNERLDGTITARQAEQQYEPLRRRMQERRSEPYQHQHITENKQCTTAQQGYLRWQKHSEEVYITQGLAEEAEEGDEESADAWMEDWKRKTLIRVHRESRLKPFKPYDKECPMKLGDLTSHRTTVKVYEDGRRTKTKSNWRQEGSGREEDDKGPPRQWIGFTEFKLKKHADMKQVRAWMVKKNSSELREEDIPAEEWPEWKKADKEEWQKVLDTGAVKVLTEEESKQVVKQLREAGTASRILPSRIVRRWKPSEQPGKAATRKSRWCIRGDKDPDLLQLNRYAPTVTTAVVSIAMQLAANKGFKTYIADLKNAFMQSDQFQRTTGRLFYRQPKEGLPGMSSEQIIEVLAGAYGLGDAPAHWRKSLKKVLIALGYMQSEMDPCTFKYFGTDHKGNKVLRGIIIVEVDDLLCFGDQMHDEKLAELRQRFNFGKFVELSQEAEGASFNGRRIRAMPEGGYEIDMTKFIEERLQEVPLQKGRSTEKEDLATEEEVAATRASVGALTWAAKEGRPDCAAGASLIAGCLNRLKVQDILDLNKIIKETKENSTMSIKIQAIPEDSMCFGVITDASYANAGIGSSQGGFGVLCYEKGLAKNGCARGNLLYWRSGKIQRVVNSTLAAETQSLAKGLQELAWCVTVYNEMSTPDFELKKWEEAAKQRRLEALTKEDIDPTLKEGLCIVDAKSLYDHLVKSTVGTTDDRRTAIEMQVVRQSLAETATEIKWVRHERMLVDCLTKRFGNRGPLYEFLRSGWLDFNCSQEKLIGVCESFEH